MSTSTSNTAAKATTNTTTTNTTTTTGTTSTTTTTVKPKPKTKPKTTTKSQSSLSTKQNHPVLLSSFAPTGCEYSTWAYITSPRPTTTTTTGKSDDDGDDDGAVLPNLVTAHANSIKIYVVDPFSGTLLLASTYDHLAGTIVSLHTLPRASGRGKGMGDMYDGLLVGFAGHPRLSIVYPPGTVAVGVDDSNSNWNGVLTASSIIDLTPALMEQSLGSAMPLELDLECAVNVTDYSNYSCDDKSKSTSTGSGSSTGNGTVPTVAVILGGGISIATFQLPRSNITEGTATGTGTGTGDNSNSNASSAWWRTASEPYFLPLASLAENLISRRASSTANPFQSTSNNKYHRHYHNNPNANTQTISHGFGDILSMAFLNGYTSSDPVLCILHSNPHRYGGRPGSGRLGYDPNAAAADGARISLCLTAISLSIPQRRSVVLWSISELIPSSAISLHSHPHGGVLIVGVNEVLYVNCAGRLECCTAVNGWIKSTHPSVLWRGYTQPNPSPLNKLSIQLDGCRISFVNASTAIIAVRDGTLYSLELHLSSNENEEEGCKGVGGGREGMCLSVSPLGRSVNGVGCIGSLSALPLVNVKMGMGMSMGTGTGTGTKNNNSTSWEKILKEKHDTHGSLGALKKEEEGLEADDALPKKEITFQDTSLGLVFCGSRMGDSSLIMYGLEEKKKLLPLDHHNDNDNTNNARDDGREIDSEKDTTQDEDATDAADVAAESNKRKREDDDDDEDKGNADSDEGISVKKEKLDNANDGDDDASPSPDDAADATADTTAATTATATVTAAAVSDDDTLSEDEILRREEEALYQADAEITTTTTPATLISGTETLLPGISAKQLYRPQLQSLSVFQHVAVLDKLTGTGPIGMGCSGPIPTREKDAASLANTASKAGNGTSATGMGSTVNIHPCGHGTSGGLALISAPGLNAKKTIVEEIDCLDIECIYTCPTMGLFFVPKKGSNKGCMILKMVDGGEGEDEDGGKCLEEMDVDSLIEGEEDVDADMEEEMEMPPSFESVKDVLTKMNIISLKEFTSSDGEEKHIIIMVKYGSAYALIVLSMGTNDKLSIVHSHFIGSHDDGACIQREGLVRASFVEHLDASTSTSKNRTLRDDDLSLACVWSSGCASIFSICKGTHSSDSDEWMIKEVIVSKDMDVEEAGAESKSTKEEAPREEEDGFYKDGRIVAVDIFAVADNIFDCESDANRNGNGERSGQETKAADQAESAANAETVTEYVFDEDDLDLYGEEEVGPLDTLPVPVGDTAASAAAEQQSSSTSHTQMAPSRYNTLGGYISAAGLSKTSKVVIAITRQSGVLELLDVAMLFKGDGDDETISMVKQLTREDCVNALLWNCTSGCGLGASVLNTNFSSTKEGTIRTPKVHDTCASEIRFFFSGPSNASPKIGVDKEEDSGRTKDLSILRSLCLVVETSDGDVHLYTGSKPRIGPGTNSSSSTNTSIAFKRVSIQTVARPSKEEAKHRNKLKRRGMLAAPEGQDQFDAMYKSNRLHRFFSISGEDGLFAATSRPLWFLSERGAPAVLSHRLRHCAPAGGTAVPVTGFCSGFTMSDEGNAAFMTVHDRIGRVGSQRLTLFNGLSDVFVPNGLLPGGGVCVEKILLGVTVRQIHYVSDPSISTPSHPIYVLLVSREIQADQSHLNDDGLSFDEKQEIKEERERKKMAKQVEADLGGFDADNEWVEEIDREECFEIEKRYGGCPPISKSVYEVWMVDSSNWNILDTYQLNEFEHGMSMKLMPLTDIPIDPATGTSSQTEEESYEEKAVLVIGTGMVDKDGEDVGSKGRLILLDIKRSGDRTGKFEAEMNFLYDKDMSLGPVTNINCLSAEGKHRLIVGAGAEITIEQWGSGKLTQIGFYHCNMQVQDLIIFKNFLLLSDAYDSLHFLVYRESDKSLTLLAKDYEPTSMYAAGLLSRGGTLSFVCHDDRQNLTFLSYAPNDAAARGGNKLVCRADCHLGTQTIALQSHFCRSSLTVNSATTQSTLAAMRQQDALFGKADDNQRFGLHYGSTDGGFGTIIPVNENMYWRLAALQSVMSNALESDCSLSHRAWRLYRRAQRRGGCRANDRKKGVVDGDLVMKFADLPLVEQEDLASAIGSTVDLILDNLLEVGTSGMVI